jgi:alpha 1,6-mannosyltransferase
LDNLEKDSTLREQLHFQFPYDTERAIPKNVWQTWKQSRNDPDFKKQFHKFSQFWVDMDTEYSYQLISDPIAEDLINSLYGHIPQVIEAYNSLPKPILKADFFRYLILFARGGIYSDVDTLPLKPASTWVSNNKTIYNRPNDIGLVIGIEADPDREDWATYYAKRVQFCQWTIQSKPGHPMLGELIARITEITLRKKADGVLNKVQGKDSGGDIMNWTGPGIFTDEVFKYMNELYRYKSISIINPTPKNDYNEKLDIKKGIDWRFFTLMTQPVKFDDLLILPITSFSPGVGHMGSKAIDHPMAYVRHMFEGSWKPEEERMKGE